MTVPETSSSSRDSVVAVEGVGEKTDEPLKVRALSERSPGVFATRVEERRVRSTPGIKGQPAENVAVVEAMETVDWSTVTWPSN